MTAKAKKLFLFFGILIGVTAACLGLETKHSNHLGWALLFTGTAFTAIGCIYLGSLFTAARSKQLAHDRSLWLPSLGVLVICLVTPLEFLFLPAILPRSDFAQDAGLILFAGGLVFYSLSLQTPDPWKAPMDQASLKRTPSLIAILRVFLFPIPASMLLMMFGLGIGYSSLIGLFILFLLITLGFVHQMRKAHRQISG